MIENIIAGILLLVNVGRTRALEVAQDIFSVTKDEKEAAMLVTIAKFESHFVRDVQTCAITGDAGRAVTLFQMHIPPGPRRDRACKDARHAAALALRRVRLCRTLRGDDAGTIACYAGRAATDRGVVSRVESFRRVLGAMSD